MVRTPVTHPPINTRRHLHCSCLQHLKYHGCGYGLFLVINHWTWLTFTPVYNLLRVFQISFVLVYHMAIEFLMNVWDCWHWVWISLCHVQLEVFLVVCKMLSCGATVNILLCTVWTWHFSPNYRHRASRLSCQISLGPLNYMYYLFSQLWHFQWKPKHKTKIIYNDVNGLVKYIT